MEQSTKVRYSGLDDLMENMDPTLLDLVKTTLNTYTKWDLARFYSENPHVIVTAEAAARRLKRTLASVRPALEELAVVGLLQKFVYDETTTYYALAADDRTQSLIDRFIIACEDHEFRIKTVYHITQSMLMN